MKIQILLILLASILTTTLSAFSFSEPTKDSSEVLAEDAKKFSIVQPNDMKQSISILIDKNTALEERLNSANNQIQNQQNAYQSLERTLNESKQNIAAMNNKIISLEMRLLDDENKSKSKEDELAKSKENEQKLQCSKMIEISGYGARAYKSIGGTAVESLSKGDMICYDYKVHGYYHAASKNFYIPIKSAKEVKKDDKKSEQKTKNAPNSLNSGGKTQQAFFEETQQIKTQTITTINAQNQQTNKTPTPQTTQNKPLTPNSPQGELDFAEQSGIDLSLNAAITENDVKAQCQARYMTKPSKIDKETFIAKCVMSWKIRAFANKK